MTKQEIEMVAKAIAKAHVNFGDYNEVGKALGMVIREISNQLRDDPQFDAVEFATLASGR